MRKIIAAFFIALFPAASFSDIFAELDLVADLCQRQNCTSCRFGCTTDGGWSCGDLGWKPGVTDAQKQSAAQKAGCGGKQQQQQPAPEPAAKGCPDGTHRGLKWNAACNGAHLECVTDAEEHACDAKRGGKQQQQQPNEKKEAKPKEVKCDGGAAVDGKCVCPNGKKLNFFKNGCNDEKEAKPKEVKCDGGEVKDGKCVCEEPKKLNFWKHACNDPKEPKEKKCDGGTLDESGKCTCEEPKKLNFFKNGCKEPKEPGARGGKDAGLGEGSAETAEDAGLEPENEADAEFLRQFDELTRIFNERVAELHAKEAAGE